MRAQLLDLNAGHPNRGVAALQELLAGAEYETTTWDVCGGAEVPEEGLWVLSGGPGSPLERGIWRDPLLARLRIRLAAGRPLLAICFGFELLAIAAGAKVRALRADRQGVYPLRLTAHGRVDPGLSGLGGQGTYEKRSFGVFDPWPSAAVLARGPERDVTAARLGPLLLGTIFHPEADLPGCEAVYAQLLPRFLRDVRALTPPGSSS